MEKYYEIALSYAHKDKDIAEVIKEELENIFLNRFFMDSLRPEELSNASIFKEKLQNIFQRSNYSVILYSENYKEGEFTPTEMQAILQKANHEPEPHVFIIYINDYSIFDKIDNTYILTKVKRSNSGEWIVNEDVHKQIYDIIHNNIKKFMIMQSIPERKQQDEYSLNIHTQFINGVVANWKIDFDWTLSGRAYIDAEGKKLKDKKEMAWQDFWEYIRKDFLWIKENLEEKPDIIRKIMLNCHLTIAYKLGQTYGDLGQAAGNRNLVLVSSNRVKDISFTFEKEVKYNIPDNFDFCQEYAGNNCQDENIVCIISIKPREQQDILKTVKNSLEKQGQQYCKICLFQKQMTIDNTHTLEQMAQYLRSKMEKHRTDNNCTIIHLFPDTTAPLMFTLAARTIVSGKIQLYEYDPESSSYYKSLTR